MAKILITGIHGFIGSNLVRELKDDNELYGLDIVAPEKEGVIQTYSWEDLDEGRIPQVDAIVHLAGLAHETGSRQSAPERYFQINTDLTKKIYDWFLKSCAKKFVFFSSASVYGSRIRTYEKPEDEPCEPDTPYGQSKRKAEEYILEQELPTGKNYYILRPAMIHGPGNKGNLNLLFKVVEKGLPWPLGAYDNRRSFASVGNITKVVADLISGEAESGVFNVSDDNPASTNRIVEMICHANGIKSRIWHIPRWIIKPVAIVGTWLHLPLNKIRLRKLTTDALLSNTKIKTALGWEKMPISSEEGLCLTIKSLSQKK